MTERTAADRAATPVDSPIKTLLTAAQMLFVALVGILLNWLLPGAEEE